MDEKYIKKFDEWNEYAKNLDKNNIQKIFAVREVWWCAVGMNMGSEQEGKNKSFERPVLIISKINNDLVYVAPITSKIKDYSDRVTINILGNKSQIVLSQLKVISSKRLLRCISLIKIEAYQKVLLILVASFLVKAKPRNK
jgi:mRNA-degrading endonuclease toxin of MazEF toxin-antitoxin module